MENLNSNLDKILQSRQNVVSEVLNKKSGEKSGENSKLNKKIIELIVNRKQEEKKEPEIKLSPSINLKNLMINIDMDGLNEKDKEKLLEYSINMGIVKEIVMKKGCEFILDVFKQKEKTIIEELNKYGYYAFDGMVDLLENIKEKFEEKSEYKNNVSLLPVVSADLENLKKQVYDGRKKFKEFLKKYIAKRDELIKINKEFVEFLNNLKKDSKVKNNRKEVEVLCSKIAEKVYELEKAYKELHNYEINKYLAPTSKLIKELQEKWEKIFLKLKSKESKEKNELDLDLSITKIDPKKKVTLKNKKTSQELLLKRDVENEKRYVLNNIFNKNQLENKMREKLLEETKREKLQERPKDKKKFTYIEFLRKLCDEKKKKSFDEYYTKSFNSFSNKINEFEDFLKDIKNNHWGVRSSLFETAAKMFKTNHGKNKNKAKEIEEINNDALTFKQKTSAVLNKYFNEINNYKGKLDNFNTKRKEFLELLNKYDEKLNMESLNTLTNMKSFNKLFNIKSFKKLLDLKIELDKEPEKLKNTLRGILDGSDFEIQPLVELGKQFEKKWNCTIMETKSGGKFIAFGKNVFEFSNK